MAIKMIEYGEVRGPTETRMTGQFQADDEVHITFSVPQRNNGFTLGAAQVSTDAMFQMALDGDQNPGSLLSLSRNVQDPAKAAGPHEAVITADGLVHDMAIDLTVR